MNIISETVPVREARVPTGLVQGLLVIMPKCGGVAELWRWSSGPVWRGGHGDDYGPPAALKLSNWPDVRGLVSGFDQRVEHLFRAASPGRRTRVGLSGAGLGSADRHRRRRGRVNWRAVQCKTRSRARRCFACTWRSIPGLPSPAATPPNWSIARSSIERTAREYRPSRALAMFARSRSVVLRSGHSARPANLPGAAGYGMCRRRPVCAQHADGLQKDAGRWCAGGGERRPGRRCATTALRFVLAGCRPGGRNHVDQSSRSDAVRRECSIVAILICSRFRLSGRQAITFIRRGYLFGLQRRTESRDGPIEFDAARSAGNSSPCPHSSPAAEISASSPDSTTFSGNARARSKVKQLSVPAVGEPGSEILPSGDGAEEGK